MEINSLLRSVKESMVMHGKLYLDLMVHFLSNDKDTCSSFFEVSSLVDMTD